jgi:hypothetical protein
VPIRSAFNSRPVSAAASLLFLAAFSGCQREPVTPARTAATVPAHSSFASSDCRECHEDVHKAWSGSHHALAHRPVNAA